MSLDRKDLVVEWIYLDPRKWWASHRKSVLLAPGTSNTFRGDCPWRGKHKQADTLAEIVVSSAPTFSCSDSACAAYDFAALTKHWSNGWMYAQAPEGSRDEEEANDDDGFEALGFSLDGSYYYQSKRNGHIVSIGAGEHTELKLYQIVPNGKFWKMWGGSSSGISWKMIARMMIEKCHAKGYYTLTETRGSGVFMDRGRIVVNLGSCLLVNSPDETSFTPVHMANFKGDFTYASPKRMILPEPLDKEGLDKIMPLLEQLPFSDKSEAMLLAGAIVCGHLAGALPWRPHFWLNGMAAGGKSDVLRLALTALQPTQFYFKGDTTAAGIRDSIRNAAGLVVVDEVEKMGGSSERMSSMGAIKRVDNLTEMMRSASDGSVAKVAKGGPGGMGYEVQIRCCAFFSSIYYGIEMAQDYRRFCFLRLSNPETRDPNQKKRYKAEIRPALEKTFTPEFAMRLYSWSVINSRWILDTIEFFRQNMLDFAKDAGEADQWGTVLGAAWCLAKSDVTPTSEDVQTLFQECYNNMESMAWEALDAGHGEQVYQALMQSQPQGEHVTIGSQVESQRYALKTGRGDDNGSYMWLAMRGIVIDGDNMLLCPGHRQLRKLMAEEGYRDFKQAFMSRKGVEVRVCAEKIDFAGFKAGRVLVVPLPRLMKIRNSADRALARQLSAADVAAEGRQD